VRQVCYPEPRLCDSHIHLFRLGRPAIRGDRCLARELVHQIQQRRGGAPDKVCLWPKLCPSEPGLNTTGIQLRPEIAGAISMQFPNSSRPLRHRHRSAATVILTRRRMHFRPEHAERIGAPPGAGRAPGDGLSRLDCSSAPRSGRDSAPRARKPGAAGRGSTGCPRSRKPRPRSHRPCAVLIQSIMAAGRE
jgi:hypothetical protein